MFYSEHCKQNSPYMQKKKFKNHKRFKTENVWHYPGSLAFVGAVYH